MKSSSAEEAQAAYQELLKEAEKESESDAYKTRRDFEAALEVFEKIQSP